jgi:AraC-like DNA-binding protein
MTPSSRDIEENHITRAFLRQLEWHLGQDRALFLRALDSAGIEADFPSQKLLSLRQYDHAIEAASRGDPSINLRIHHGLSIHDLGLIGYAIAGSDNLFQALTTMNQYHDLTSDRYQQYLEQDGSECRLFLNPLPGWREQPALVEDCFGGLWRVLEELVGEQVELARIRMSFAYAEPIYGQVYRDTFACSLQFEDERSELRFPAEWLDLPLFGGLRSSSHNSQLLCEAMLGPPSSDSSTAQRVKRLLLERPSRRLLSLDEAARALNFSRAQLRKRLYREGHSYRSLVLEVRMLLAGQYLQNTRLSSQQIAYLLNYSQQSAFERAFKGCFAETPAAFRKRLEPL